MFVILQAILYYGSYLVLFFFLVLPILVLLAVSILFFASDLVRLFWRGQGM